MTNDILVTLGPTSMNEETVKDVYRARRLRVSD